MGQAVLSGCFLLLPVTLVAIQAFGFVKENHTARTPGMANQDRAMESTESTEEVDEVYVDFVHGDSNATDAIALSAKMMQDPQALAAMQERGDTRTTSPSVYMESLPKVVKRRVNALRNLQVKCAHIEAKFYEEVHELERKYAALYQPHFNRRREIVSGEIEPTDQECEWVEEKDEDAELADEVMEKVKLSEEQNDAESANPNGIPEFWLTVFRNVDLLSDMVQEHDEPILRHLHDIKVKFSEQGIPMSFTLDFCFSPNEYFTNAVLTKTYVMKSEPDASDPFSFEGPEIVSCTGSQIDWKKGKDVTVKVIKKKQKHKGRGTVRTLTKTVPNDSFFNFFNPPQVAEGEELDEDSEVILTADFEIGHFFRERVVPRAVLYFTGEAIEDEEEYEEEEEEDEEDGQEEEGDEEDDEDEKK
ncbi:nucleosome assembly protein 1-like 4 isoform X1 [Petromyzon marinus]|uniref:Nucleosome assembly protein 1-like 4 isoform X1 n=2 Tax=Petromyzon marinus TaxID=7757 RepID=A0AAJ7TC63_PETMA|nr:nucleosome assembly protein 1-like 4 isoform X1 [Petromyzon marinus]